MNIALGWFSLAMLDAIGWNFVTGKSFSTVVYVLFVSLGQARVCL
jgi:hypothetical protein